MLNDVSTGGFPKTLEVRNTEDGMIWQIYHVKGQSEIDTLYKNAINNAFQSVTVVNHDPVQEETFPDWRKKCADEDWLVKE